MPELMQKAEAHPVIKCCGFNHHLLLHSSQSSWRRYNEMRQKNKRRAATHKYSPRIQSPMNCEICNKKLATTFLKKLTGTYVKDDKGKKHTFCFECQKKFPKKEQLLEAMKK
jgi:hypothetical protein